MLALTLKVKETIYGISHIEKGPEDDKYLEITYSAVDTTMPIACVKLTTTGVQINIRTNDECKDEDAADLSEALNNCLSTQPQRMPHTLVDTDGFIYVPAETSIVLPSEFAKKYGQEVSKDALVTKVYELAGHGMVEDKLVFRKVAVAISIIPQIVDNTIVNLGVKIKVLHNEENLTFDTAAIDAATTELAKFVCKECVEVIIDNLGEGMGLPADE